MGRWSYQKTEAELREELSEQVAMLRASAAAYDSGTLWEAKRLATTAFTLLANLSGGGRGGGLLTLLGIRDAVQFVSTIPDKYKTDQGYNLPLCHIHVPQRASECYFIARLDKSKHRNNITFSAWAGELAYNPTQELSLTRFGLIHFMRSQHGGSHVDQDITNEAYHTLITQGTPRLRIARHDKGFTFVVDGKRNLNVLKEAPKPDDLPPDPSNPEAVPIERGHLATMRQIAWEIDESLKAIGL